MSKIINEKGLKDYLNDDTSLMETITYEEHIDNAAASDNTNESIAVTKIYKRIRSLICSSSE